MPVPIASDKGRAVGADAVRVWGTGYAASAAPDGSPSAALRARFRFRQPARWHRQLTKFTTLLNQR